MGREKVGRKDRQVFVIADNTVLPSYDKYQTIAMLCIDMSLIMSQCR